MIIIVIAVYLIIGIIEMLPLYKKKNKKELIFYSFFWVIALTMSILLILDIKILSPVKPIEKMVLTILGK